MKKGARICVEDAMQCNDDLENQLVCQKAYMCQVQTFLGPLQERDICHYNLMEAVSLSKGPP